MKRIWIALALLAVTLVMCFLTQAFQHRQMGRMLADLDRLEEVYNAGDRAAAVKIAEEINRNYQRITSIMDCYVAHNDLAASQETAALLPVLIQQGGEEELQMELARLREQIGYLQDIDDPLPENIL